MARPQEPVAGPDLPTVDPVREAPSPSDRLELLVIGERAIATAALPATGEVRIGRGRDCDVVVDDAAMSRQHAALAIGPPLVLRDLGSAHGTRAKDRTLAAGEAIELAPGDVVQLGNTTLIVQVRAAEEPADSPMDELHRLVERIAAGTITVLVLGETGVGKEVLAERIHRASARRDQPYLKLNCGALSETLLESELFGHEKGAFTGAVQTKPGLLETADGGTVFLDEIGEMPLAIQVKLLRVLEERVVTRVGGLRPRAIDVRFIAATNRDLQAEIQRGAFRQDLFFRIDGATLVIPPLRERVSEIPELASGFIARAARELGIAPPVLATETLDALRAHDWPGNIRELRNVIDRAVLLSHGATLLPAHLPIELRAKPGDADERARILDALAKSGGNQSQAAQLLGIARRTLINKLERHGISGPRKKREP